MKNFGDSNRQIEIPNIPDIKPPNVTLPDIQIPEVNIPDIQTPNITVPDIQAPNVTVGGIVISGNDTCYVAAKNAKAPKGVTRLRQPAIYTSGKWRVLLDEKTTKEICENGKMGGEKLYTEDHGRDVLRKKKNGGSDSEESGGSESTDGGSDSGSGDGGNSSGGSSGQTQQNDSFKMARKDDTALTLRLFLTERLRKQWMICERVLTEDRF